MTDLDLDLFTPPGKLGETFDLALDGERLKSNQARVLALLSDGVGHTVEELRAVGGQQGERRARGLRDPKCGGLPLDVTRTDCAGVWYYRLAVERITADQWETAKRALGLAGEG